MRPFEKLQAREQKELLGLRQASATAETIYQLVQEFFRLVCTRQGTQLDSWMSKVEASGIPELQRFANGLERDKAAVLAGLTLSHSNGQVEGQGLLCCASESCMHGTRLLAQNKNDRVR